jgi:hypothetical protein
VDESLDTHFLCALQQDVGAVHIRVGEAVRVPEAEINVRLSGEVEDGVDVVSF